MELRFFDHSRPSLVARGISVFPQTNSDRDYGNESSIPFWDSPSLKWVSTSGPIRILESQK
jgi:hypothetical protein